MSGRRSTAPRSRAIATRGASPSASTRAPSERLTLRAGIQIDPTPTRDATRDPRVPDGNRADFNIGASLQDEPHPLSRRRRRLHPRRPEPVQPRRELLRRQPGADRRADRRAPARTRLWSLRWAAGWGSEGRVLRAVAPSSPAADRRSRRILPSISRGGGPAKHGGGAASSSGRPLHRTSCGPPPLRKREDLGRRQPGVRRVDG